MDAPFPEGLESDLRDFLASGHRPVPPDPVCAEVFRRPLLFPLQRQAEMRRMLEIARGRSPVTACEVGSDKGGSLLHWCWLPTVKRVIGCEVRGTPYAPLFESAFPKHEFLWLPCSSRDEHALRRARRWLTKPELIAGRSIGVLFLDGDKSFFEADFDAWLPLMAPGGVVFFHDVTDEAPGEAYRRVCGRGYRHEEIIDRSDWDAEAARETAGLPPPCPHAGWLREWRGRSCGVGVVYL